MFTYLIKTDNGQIFSKDEGFCYIRNPMFDPANYTPEDLFTFEGKTIVFSDVDIPAHDLALWVYTCGQFTMRSPEEISVIKQHEATEQLRKERFLLLKQEVVSLNFDQLTPQHKKILIGVTFEQFTEADWAALGL